jgi:hypothetical protein
MGPDHFVDVNKMLGIGKGGQRSGNPKKEGVAGDQIC